MTDKPAEGNGDEQPQGDFANLTPEEFLARTADGTAKEAPAPMLPTMPWARRRPWPLSAPRTCNACRPNM